MQTSKYWTISAGYKSLYLLPKISDDRSFNRLKKAFNLSADKPSQLFDQSNLFNQISKFQNEDNIWTADVLIFSKKWFDKSMDCFDKLRLYILEEACENSKFLRDYRYFNFSLSRVIGDIYLNPNPYIKDTINHLYLISEGQRPIFMISTNDRSAPVDFLQNTFDNIYGIPKVPLFIETNHLKNVNDQASYHSLTLPVLTDFLPKYRQSTNMVDIVELYEVSQELFYIIKDHNIDESIYSIINNWTEK